jgi:hypothetical protein
MQLVDPRFEQEFARRLRQELDAVDVPSRPFRPVPRRWLPVRQIAVAVVAALTLSAVAGVITGSANPSVWAQKARQVFGIQFSPLVIPTSSASPSPSKATVPVRQSSPTPSPEREPGDATPSPSRTESPEPHDAESPEPSGSGEHPSPSPDGSRESG